MLTRLKTTYYSIPIFVGGDYSLYKGGGEISYTFTSPVIS